MTVSGYTKHVIPCELKSGCQSCTCLSLLSLGDGEGLAVKSCSSLLMSDLCVPPGRAEGKYFELAWNRCRYKVYTACQENESRCHIHPFAYWEDEWYVWECICLHTWINSVSLTGSGSKQTDHDLGCQCPYTQTDCLRHLYAGNLFTDPEEED